MPDLRNLSFEHLLNFVAVVETGSFTRAAARRGLAKTTVSDSVQRLERELGTTLLARTTRRLSLTEAGAAFHDTCREIVRLGEAAVAAASPAAQAPLGTLRVASSVEYSAVVLAPVLAQLRQLHPALRIDLVSADRTIDLIEDGIDVAIRLGELVESSHRAVRVGEYAKWLVASPAFVARHPVPDAIGEAQALPFVALSVLAQPSRFTMLGDECGTPARTQALSFAPGLVADTVYACRAAVAEGAGLAVLPDFSVRADLAAGRLVRLYPDWATARTAIHALLPPGRHVAPKVRAFLDLLRAARDADR